MKFRNSNLRRVKPKRATSWNDCKRLERPSSTRWEIQSRMIWSRSWSESGRREKSRRYGARVVCHDEILKINFPLIFTILELCARNDLTFSEEDGHWKWSHESHRLFECFNLPIKSHIISSLESFIPNTKSTFGLKRLTMRTRKVKMLLVKQKIP